MPIFHIFVEPADEIGYAETIKNPQDFSSILARLQKKQYTKFQKIL